ncbi:protein lethal(2)essential for life [Hyalella azteca]|uniref:Protein lethal(2)essential for life n=1 Tax=Hyalella azteca TaxID=294128 RepID=A0A8B7MZZ8_HYAAZ|nr:protein lethal(2)essential for life [Hyalella azteca]
MSKTISLIKRESFFDDSFFQDAWGDFDSAIQTILDKFHDKTVKVDSGSRNECRDVYRNIRSSRIDDDIYASQALQVTEKDGRFSCVMDVKDFNPNDLQVKVVEDRVIVEGKYEKKSEDGSCVSSKSFYKEFTMPKSANLDQVSTALSKDGVLTVRAPKKEGSEVATAGDGTVSKSSVQQSSSSSVQQSSTSTSTSVKKQSVSSSFTSTSSVSKSSQLTSSSSITSSFDDMAKEMNDRLVFTHESVNLKLPEN